MTEKKTKAAEAALEQFPSDLDADKVEIAERTTDTDAASSSRFVKVFLVRIDKLDHQADLHEDNSIAVLQEAIQQGLHPRGDVRFDGAKPYGDDVSQLLTYSVDVVPAHTDHEAAETVTPTISKLDN